jgi:hypothetical protein
MAIESQYDKFGGAISHTVEENEQLGTPWKGLKVMEEYWRLRREEPGMWGQIDNNKNEH